MDSDSSFTLQTVLRIQFAICALFVVSQCEFVTMFRWQKYCKYYYFKQLKKKRLCLCLFFLTMLQYESYERRIWVRKWVARRKEKGLHNNLFLELILEDPDRYRRFIIN